MPLHGPVDRRFRTDILPVALAGRSALQPPHQNAVDDLRHERERTPDAKTKSGIAGRALIVFLDIPFHRSAFKGHCLGAAGAGWKIEGDAPDNRVSITFDAIPVPEIRARIKSAGFRWSPTRGAWVHQRNNAAWAAARYAMGETS